MKPVEYIYRIRIGDEPPKHGLADKSQQVPYRFWGASGSGMTFDLLAGTVDAAIPGNCEIGQKQRSCAQAIGFEQAATTCLGAPPPDRSGAPAFGQNFGFHAVAPEDRRNGRAIGSRVAFRAPTPC